MKNKKILLRWIPSAVTAVLAVITCIIYTVLGARRGAMGYFQLFGCMLVPMLFPLYEAVFKKELPPALSAIVAVHVVLANFLGTILDFYRMIDWWDLFMHGMFGVTGGIIGYALIMLWHGDKLSKTGLYVFILSFVLCCGVLWEIFEYVTDGIFPQNDSQVTKGLVGREAVRDTMEDLMISIAGVAVLYAGILIDKLAKLGLCERLLTVPQKPAETVNETENN